MYLKQAVIFVFFFVSCQGATRIWLYKNCGKNGFTCITKNKKMSIIYQCPLKTTEYQIVVNEFNGPASTESLIIKNCKTLTVLFRCSTFKSEKKNLKYLELSNIEKLKIQPSLSYHSQLPPTVVIENITLIEAIPSLTFAQVDSSRIKNRRCILPRTDFHSISFRNVTINTVHSHAFYMPRKFGNVSFTDSRINILHTSALRVNHQEDGVFLMRQSTVEVLHPSALHVAGKSVIFSGSKFAKIPSSGINVTAETFYFVDNSVKTLQPYALSVLSSNTFILNNRFQWLNAGALKKIRPRLISDSKVKRIVTFVYNFTGNFVNSTEADCLHPDVTAYSREMSKISFLRNTLPCTCGTSDWLISAMDNFHITNPKIAFYSMAFDRGFENVCSESCHVPIANVKPSLKHEACLQDDTIEQLCKNPDGNVISASTVSAKRQSINFGQTTPTSALMFKTSITPNFSTPKANSKFFIADFVKTTSQKVRPTATAVTVDKTPFGISKATIMPSYKKTHWNIDHTTNSELLKATSQKVWPIPTAVIANKSPLAVSTISIIPSSVNANVTRWDLDQTTNLELLKTTKSQKVMLTHTETPKIRYLEVMTTEENRDEVISRSQGVPTFKVQKMIQSSSNNQLTPVYLLLFFCFLQYML